MQGESHGRVRFATSAGSVSQVRGHSTAVASHFVDRLPRILRAHFLGFQEGGTEATALRPQAGHNIVAPLPVTRAQQEGSAETVERVANVVRGGLQGTEFSLDDAKVGNFEDHRGLGARAGASPKHRSVANVAMPCGTAAR